jgi:hypothetical protein
MEAHTVPSKMHHQACLAGAKRRKVQIERPKFVHFDFVGKYFGANRYFIWPNQALACAIRTWQHRRFRRAADS